MLSYCEELIPAHHLVKVKITRRWPEAPTSAFYVMYNATVENVFRTKDNRIMSLDTIKFRSIANAHFCTQNFELDTVYLVSLRAPTIYEIASPLQPDRYATLPTANNYENELETNGCLFNRKYNSLDEQLRVSLENNIPCGCKTACSAGSDCEGVRRCFGPITCDYTTCPNGQHCKVVDKSPRCIPRRKKCEWYQLLCKIKKFFNW
jgi:hypothetical protein